MNSAISSRLYGRAVDFEAFRPDLEKALAYSTGAQGGRPPYDPVLMLKILVIQAANGLSDERAEFLISDRLSFMRFLGLSLSDRVPDARTIWLFRERLTKAGAIEPLFARFEAMLRAAGYIAMAGQIVDSSLVAAPRQPNTLEEKQEIKAGRIPAAWKERPAKLRHKDRDARWTVKFTKAKPREDGSTPPVDIAIPAFGYQNHIAIDREHGLIRRWLVTDAAASEGARLREGLLDPGNTARAVWADTAYRSAANEAFLDKHGFVSKIHRKKPKGRPMPAATRSRRYAPASSTSSPSRRRGWACSCAPSVSPGRRPRSAWPISSTTFAGSPGSREMQRHSSHQGGQEGGLQPPQRAKKPGKRGTANEQRQSEPFARPDWRVLRTVQLQAVCDGRGRPLVMLLSEGQMSDDKGAAFMIEAFPKAKAWLGDKA